MESVSQPQIFSPRPRALLQRPLCIRSSTPVDLQNLPYLNESGLLTPASEEFNQFLFESRRLQADSNPSSPSPVSSNVVAVVGVGYVGFELVQAFSKHYPVIAFDMSKQRIEALRPQVDERSIYLTSDPAEITQATHILIAVPTNVHHDTKQINTSHLKSAIQTLSKHARPGAVVVVESSVAVGMTRDLLAPLQYSRGFKVGMSPERVDPGRSNIEFEAIPKVISGLDSQSLQAIQELYEPVFDRVVPVASCEVAEMTKLYENCQRMMGIAFANEMADACQTFGIDPIDVCAAAGTKPFGYQSYLPGAGVGGHCIPVNPYYLLSNMQFPLLQAATEKMWQRPATLAAQVMDSLSTQKNRWRIPTTNVPGHPQSTPTASTRVLVIGVAFKPGQSVISHSPGIAMINHLVQNYDDVHVEFCDPLVDAQAIPGATKMNDASDWNVETLENHYDAIIVAMAQRGLDLDVLTQLHKTQVFNFTSSLKGFGHQKDQRAFFAKRDSAIDF